MNIKAAFLDHDGTLVNKDILDHISSLTNSEEKSRELNELYQSGQMPWLQALIQRVNLLKGVTQADINQLLMEEDFIMKGTEEFFSYCKENNIKTILCSWNITPVLQYYKDKLEMDHIIGTQTLMKGEYIEWITENELNDKDFKINGIKKIMREYKLSPEDCIAVGDSLADLGMFQTVGTSFAINPKWWIEKQATYTIQRLDDIVNILERKENE